MLRDGLDSTKIVLNLEVAQAHKNFRLPLKNVGCLEPTILSQQFDWDKLRF